MGTITQQRMEAAMDYMASTDEDYALQVVAVERAEILRKRVRSRIFLTNDGSNDVRKAQAEVHLDTQKADDDYLSALEAKEVTKARRERAELVIRMYQTESANRRQA